MLSVDRGIGKPSTEQNLILPPTPPAPLPPPTPPAPPLPLPPDGLLPAPQIFKIERR